jgi:hypothetical protein
MRGHHAEWLSLIEISGPFLSIPVLDCVFPQGLDAHDPEHLKNLKIAYQQWDDEAGPEAVRFNAAMHRAWIEYVLTETLGYPEDLLKKGQGLPAGLEARVAEHGETLRPDYALVNPKGVEGEGKPRLLIQVLQPDQDLEKPLAGSRWKASPDTRMMELLHATNVPLGLITNGERWMLVYAPVGETTGFASSYASLWFEEHITLRAWRTLLCTKRFFGVPPTDTIEGLLAESSENQQEVTDQLGLQVRQAVEVLVQTLDRIDLEQQRAVLQDVPATELYEASLTVMMRLVFLFCAEERGLLLLGDPLYDQHYAVSTLSAQLRETADQHGEEILERRYDAWSRLLATFRVVHAGVRHENLRLPAYGGSLFNPDRFPFLEGRQHGSSWRDTAAKSLPVDNRTVLHLMEALQYLQVSAERRRLSFRALDIEQIGHVYEGLLDHTALRAPENEPVLGLVGTRKKNETKEPEVFLSKLEDFRAKSEAALLEYLIEETGRSEKALASALRPPEPGTPNPEPGLRIACGNDEALLQRVLPFAGLIRDDTFGRPVVILPGSYYVTQGSDRRQTGTHYTPRSLTEPIVQYTLEPLVYEGPAEGKPKEEWKLRSPKEILELKVCDMAMGSGAFLVQTVRYLSERLVEAWEEREQEIVNHRCTQMDTDGGKGALQLVTENVMSRPTSRKLAQTLEQGELPSIDENPIGVNRCSSVVKKTRITPEGTPSTGDPTETLIPDNPDERLIYARRIICDRCIYGVDINPLAVEMAKLSLWLITMDKGRAFSFLNHALKCGDSLLGLWDVEQVRKFHLDASVPAQAGLWGDHIHQIFEYALQKRRELESFMVNDVRDSEAKARLLAEADAAMDVVRMLCDILITAAVTTADGNSQRRGTMLPQGFDTERDRIFDAIMAANSREQIQSAVEAVRSLIPEHQSKLNAGNPNSKNPRRPFHWPIEFPEIFSPESGTRDPKPGFYGFSAFVGNPPFMKGHMISHEFGDPYRGFLTDCIVGQPAGLADLSAFFMRRGWMLLKQTGLVGMVATNTISEGDTRRLALEPVVQEGGNIVFSNPNVKWPGSAAVIISIVVLGKLPWQGNAILKGKEVCRISTRLDVEEERKVHMLASNADLCFVGSTYLEMVSFSVRTRRGNSWRKRGSATRSFSRILTAKSCTL